MNIALSLVMPVRLDPKARFRNSTKLFRPSMIMLRKPSQSGHCAAGS